MRSRNLLRLVRGYIFPETGRGLASIAFALRSGGGRSRLRARDGLALLILRRPDTFALRGKEKKPEYRR
ncbi:MAG: hypothetical protein ACXW3F_08010 [Pyrinomonadaceae bacterium]